MIKTSIFAVLAAASALNGGGARLEPVSVAVPTAVAARGSGILGVIEAWAAKSSGARFFRGLISEELWNKALQGDWLAEQTVRRRMMTGYYNTVFFTKRIVTDAGRAAVGKAVLQGRTPYEGSFSWVESEGVFEADDDALLAAVSARAENPGAVAGFVYIYEPTAPPMTTDAEPYFALLYAEDLLNMSEQGSMLRWAVRKSGIREAAYGQPRGSYRPAR